MVNLIQIDPAVPATYAMSRQKAAEFLGISVDSVGFLLKSRYLPDLDARRLLSMAGQPWLYSDGDYPVLQQGASEHAPKKLVPPRKYIGESAAHSDIECVEANQGVWAGFNVDHVLAARFLPVTLRKFPVSVLQIHEANSADEERVSFVATLAGRVRELGAPHLNYIDKSLSAEDQEIVRTLLTSRSTSTVPGPCGKLKQPNA
ncbi:transcriptional regulator [Rhodococcus sp. SRB_17]|uniref:transcriptional regulator n=1 Tax=unclassified Rhodococcus (in: high G+C Gram-positive bacteria) TaxID=192944 RepID=UPI000B943DCE|nr:MULTISPECIES: transcriptional regulator [unclassified Rhodococcus (in: high G+C Gram-positive bacteria)]MCJ0906162.1 transcriptional regulator [Rhodococcus sp. ARC_M6]NMM91695.1 transcriptional regulator [Rhodococcus sp. SRB_17]OYD70068.1 hypothetical protein BDB13_3658 [Rhodococcus sp. OK302]